MSKLPKELYCSGCEEVTPHVPKFSAVQEGKLVCDVCRQMNPFRRNISETPEHWVILKLPYEDEIIYKVFAGWRGGYLDGDRWKMNSGVVKVESDDDYYYFYGYSGSCYKCHKKGYGIVSDGDDKVSNFGSYAGGILSNILDKSKEQGIDVELMDEKTNWNNLVLLSSKNARRR